LRDFIWSLFAFREFTHVVSKEKPNTCEVWIIPSPVPLNKIAVVKLHREIYISSALLTEKDVGNLRMFMECDGFKIMLRDLSYIIRHNNVLVVVHNKDPKSIAMYLAPRLTGMEYRCFVTRSSFREADDFGRELRHSSETPTILEL